MAIAGHMARRVLSIEGNMRSCTMSTSMIARMGFFVVHLFAFPLWAADIPQTPLDGRALPQFVDPLPTLETIVAGPDRLTLHMREFRTMPLPGSFRGANGGYAGTWTWGYLPEGATERGSYLGPVIVATRGVPTEIAWVNDLGTTAESRVLAYTQSTDQTLHWADPAHGGADACAEAVEPATPPSGECAEHYGGAIPAVVHLHGGEVPPTLDGGPDAWFTSDGAAQGHAYYSRDPGSRNAAVYRYPNVQEPAATWFHDHTLGATRLNVYAGLAGAYVVVDPAHERADLPPAIPLVIQDRIFDVDGQLYFPAGVPFVPNPSHPFWVPEFIGDVILVNGETWPYLDVPRRRVRFIIVNGSNARTYALSLVSQGKDEPGPTIWQIGTDGGYLDRPAAIGGGHDGPEHLLLMPGERADVIVDFSQVRRGTKMLLRNIARAPYPTGETVHGSTTGRVMQLRAVGARQHDATYDPASGEPLRAPMVRLADPATGTVAADVDVRVVRQLTLNEVIGDASVFGGVDYEGGPLEVLVNNTEYPGESMRSYGDFVPVSVGGVTTYYSELPEEGATEVWEIVNMTADAHPIHLHLTQFQVLNRQRFDARKYMTAYDALFPGGIEPMSGTVYPPGRYIPGFGPPLDYRADRNPAGGGKEGGNPDVTPYLRGQPKPPPANEAGWKDTVRTMPGEVTRIIVRWAPTSLPADTPQSQATYPFDPDGGHGYVWHCHIIDHEDNEMMRPTSIVANATAARTYVQGVDY
jgi:FtsP/CotA-like multicopper oxidase with cupredoxin domain